VNVRIVFQCVQFSAFSISRKCKTDRLNVQSQRMWRIAMRRRAVARRHTSTHSCRMRCRRRCIALRYRAAPYATASGANEPRPFTHILSRFLARDVIYSLHLALMLRCQCPSVCL